MKIFLVSEEYPPLTNWGGIATYSHTLAKALAERGEEVTVFSRSISDEEVIETDSAMRVIRLRCPPLEERLLASLPSFVRNQIKAPLDEFTRDRIAFILSLREKILDLCDREGKPDIIEVPDWGAAGIALIGGRAMPLKYLAHLHTPTAIVDEANNIPNSKRFKLISALEVIAIKRAQMVVSPSQFMAGTVIKRFNLDFKRVNVIPHPLDGKFWAEASDACPKSIPEKPYLLYAGRLEYRKGVALLIEAYANLLKKKFDVALMIVGSDTPTAPGGTSYEAMLFKLAKALGIAEKIIWLPNLSRQRLKGFLQNARAFVLPSLYENAPYILLEAQAAGASVVAFDTGGVGEYITHDEDGLLVPTANAAALALTLERLLADERLRNRLSQRARARALAALNPAYIARLTSELYQQVVFSG
ncbi:MAG: hypothetical protein Kow0090_19030 [Myxococcota bacterium]